MTCGNCSYQYCWRCKKEWNGHGDFYVCNRFERKKRKYKVKYLKKKNTKENKATQLELGKEEHRQHLEWYLLCYNQYIEHDRRMKCTSKMQEEVNLKLQEWLDHDGKVDESHFVERALSVLVLCHRALKWSCVRMYYFDDRNFRKNLFEYMKNDLEKSVLLLENFLKELPSEKIGVIDGTLLCEIRMSNLLSWHSTCL